MMQKSCSIIRADNTAKKAKLTPPPPPPPPLENFYLYSSTQRVSCYRYYRIAGNFRGVQIFRVFRGCSLILEIKVQTFQYFEDRRTGINRTQPCIYDCMHANSNEMDAKLAS